MRIYTTLIFIFSLTFLSAQDTLHVMHYNLLYYGNSAFCNESNNNTDQKDAYLRTIVEYMKPDIFTVNEMSKVQSYQTRVLEEVFMQLSYADFEMAEAPNIANASIVNQLYYNTDKLVLHSQEVAQSYIRDINVYRLYYKTQGLVNGDTVFLNCIVGHLKSGDNSGDEAKRVIMVENTIDYLEANGHPGNYLFMGDFNFYRSSDDAFQLMITNPDPIFRFYDPVDEIGSWHNNAAYQDVHTQSTRTSGGCGASGGMDDRFDFILTNQVIRDETEDLYYVDGSYWALGQDGERLNGTIVDPPNTSMPAYIIDALFGMSDHLPVVMDLYVDDPVSVAENNFASSLDVKFRNPAQQSLSMWISTETPGKAEIFLISLTGKVVYQELCSLDRRMQISIPLDSIPSGMYFLRVQHTEGFYTGKVIVIR